MDFRLTPENERFRQEVRQFIADNWTVGVGRYSEEGWEAARQFEQRLGAKGWLTMAWPKEYGGAGADPITRLIFSEECAYADADLPENQGVWMVGPVLMMYGSDEQKQRFLPPMARSEVVWCQGFSEPNAGSDLASLQTRALRDGDDYIISGEKVWTSAAVYADWIHVLCRTDPDAPKHRGISYFMVDMRSPGITVLPIINMLGEHGGFAQTIFDNARVPANQMIGEENRGWYVAMATLEFERSEIATAARLRRSLEELAEVARGGRHDGRGAAARTRLAELFIEVEVCRQMAYRVAWLQDAGQPFAIEASVIKVFASELAQRVTNCGLSLLGLSGALRPSSPHARLRGKMERDYLWSVAGSIYSGTNEVQRNIIATRGLGLPRE